MRRFAILLLVLTALVMLTSALRADDADDIVQALIERHALKSVSPSIGEAQVYRAYWNYCDLDAKRNTVKILSIFCAHHGGDGHVVLLDARSGKRLAEYGRSRGLEIVGEN